MNIVKKLLKESLNKVYNEPNSNLDEINIRHKGKFDDGQEHIIYPTRNKNMLIKIGPPVVVDRWLPLFEKYPDLFPKVYKTGFTKKDRETFKYVVVEKLNTENVIAEWDIMNDALNEICENDEDYLEYCFDDMTMTFLKALITPDFNNTISSLLKQFKPNVYKLYSKWFNFIYKVNQIVKPIKNGDILDAHGGNFGYDSSGNIKCLDI